MVCHIDWRRNSVFNFGRDAFEVLQTVGRPYSYAFLFDWGFHMPRKALIDVAVAFHHIICRGVESSKIFIDAVSRTAQRGERLANENNLFPENI